MTKWEEHELSEISEVRAGSPAPQGDEYFDPDGIPFVRVQDVGRYGRTTCLKKTKDRINQHAIDTLHPVFAKAGTILFPKSGAAINTNSRAILGVDAYVVSHLAMITAKDDIVLPEWLYYWFCSFDLASLSRTTSLPSVRLSDIKQLKIPFPEISEQHRIVARINDCMERVEEIELLHNSSKQDAVNLPKAFRYDLWQACIEQEKLIPFSEVVESTKNGLYKPAKYHGDGIVLLRMFNINGASFDTTKIVRMQVTEKESKDYNICNGDIIVSRVNSRELVGKSCVVEGMNESAVFEAMLIRLRINENKADRNFLMWLANSPQFLHDLRGRAKHAIGQSSINQKDLLSSKIPLPPLKEQKKLVEKNENLVPYASSLLDEYLEKEKISRGLRESILHKAFAGEL